jgi:mannose-1-phosphate guanylyltransferase/phosphomannomutase
MRATAGPDHKVLRPVLGVPLLERNLCRLLDCGFSEIAVAVSAQERPLQNYLTTRGRTLAKARHATLAPIAEQHPLGTIGVIHQLRHSSEPVVVINGDNLTNLDLRAVLGHHRRSGADMTVAVHREPFRVPLGEVSIIEGELVAYNEKPIHELVISSGAYVVEPTVAAMLGRGQRCDVPELVSLVIGAGGSVAAYSHDSLWMDVNDAADLRRCEALVRDHTDAFERWESEPDRHVLDLLLHDDSHILVTRSSKDGSGLCGLPSEDCGPQPSRADVGRLSHRCGQNGHPPRTTQLTSFDEIDVGGATLVRHHVFHTEVSDLTATADDSESTWIPISPAAQNGLLFSSALERVLTYLNHGP